MKKFGDNKNKNFIEIKFSGGGKQRIISKERKGRKQGGYELRKKGDKSIYIRGCIEQMGD